MYPRNTAFAYRTISIETPSGWRILLSNLNPLERPMPVPSIVEIITRSMTLGSAGLARRARSHCDLLLTPPAQNCRTHDFEAIDDLVEIGYRYALGRLGGDLDPRIARYMFFRYRKDGAAAGSR